MTTWQQVLRRPAPPVGTLRFSADGSRWERWSGRFWRQAVYSADPAALRSPDPLGAGAVLPADEQQRLLGQALDAEVLNGGTLVARTEQGAVLLYRAPVSHVLHAALTLVTLGLWAVVWLAMALGRREDRVRLVVDPHGHVWVDEPLS